ncbi:hypothetical protein [Streptomyces achromogenes]|uniref:hypothetical protein n=1 Tax=Streptomyces achromogenes TaxID=67255 RepID=UPI0036874720
MRTVISKGCTIVVGAAAAFALTLTSAPFSSAAVPVPVTLPSADSVVQCAGTEAITYEPGLTLTPRQVTLRAEGTLGPCVTLAGSDYSGGQITFQGSGYLSCSVGGSSSGTAEITWLGGERSRFTFQGAVSLRPDGVTILVLTGEVTSGAFVGEKVVNTITLASSDLTDCLTASGLTSTSGPITLNINPLV